VTIRLYFDEDSMRYALVNTLRARGIDVQTALGVEMRLEGMLTLNAGGFVCCKRHECSRAFRLESNAYESYRNTIS
jgi:hypothetical protein